MKEKLTSKVTKGGLFTAVGVLLVFLSSYLPTSKLFLLLCASAVIPISVLTTGIKNSNIVYISTAILSFLIIGFRPQTLLYLSFFGVYGLVKYYIEAKNNLKIEVLYKFIFFNLSAVLVYFSYKLFLLQYVNLKYSLLIIYLAAIVFFIGFDWLLTLYIGELRKRLPSLKKY